MRSFASASSQYIEATTAALEAAPFTLACWARPVTLTATQTALSLGHATLSRYVALGYLSTGKAFCESFGATTNSLAESTGSISANSLNHIAVVSTGIASRAVYLNGTAGSTQTTSIGAITGVTRTTIGSLFQTGARSSYFNGQVGDAAMWTVALGATEITALAKGADPRTVRPGSLVMHAPMILGASPEIDLWKNRLNLVLGATTQAPTMSVLEPPMLRPNGLMVADPAEAAAAGKAPPFAQAERRISRSPLVRM